MMAEVPSTAVGNPVADATRPEISSSIPAARYKSMSPACLPISRSPCLTIPAGFSPTALLESPVLLTNVKAEPSPTTGTFGLPFFRNDVGSFMLESPKESSKSLFQEDASAPYYGFRPHIRSCTRPGLSSLAPLASVGSNFKQQEPGRCEELIQSPSQLLKNENNPQLSDELDLSVVASDSPVEAPAIKSNVSAEDASNECSGSNLSTAVEKSAEDGYNWRKYGQKHVKGSEFPRSYYKCTHPNCQMKKQLERSLDGQITDIVYKGRHDHPKPQPSRRVSVGSIFATGGEDKEDGFSSLEITEEKFPNAHGHASYNANPTEFSPASVSCDEAEAGGAHFCLVAGEVADDEDPESKRRKMEAAAIEANPMAKNNREPRVVVQTISEVDILDDGYRWRKYGQKIVKGNPNPRSYYKCTNPRCSVRKHVERASHDPKSVITTYEGKHNHEVPAARTNSSHEEPAPVISDCTGNHFLVAPGNLPPPGTYYPRLEEKSGINLRLGVGVGSKDGNKVVPMLYGGSNRVAFGYSEGGGGEGFSFTTQIDNSSSHYCPRTGKL